MFILTNDGASEMGCMGVWGVLGIRGVQAGVWYNRSERGRHPHMG